MIAQCRLTRPATVVTAYAGDDVDERSAPSPDHHDATGEPPGVMLVHGWGGSFDTTWVRTGVAALLEDAGRTVIGVDLLGHGTAPKPHDPSAYDDLTPRVVERLPDRPVDAVGFSLGAMTLLRAVIDHPARFRRLVLAGIGTNVFQRDDAATARLVTALEAGAAPEDPVARLFAQYARQPGNDIVALTAVLQRTPAAVVTREALARVRCPTLVVIGDRDMVYPADDLVAALPHARSVVVRNVDHFATPESFGFIDAMLEFLDAVPS